MIISDERRIASLMSKFSAPEVTTASSTATAGTNSSGTSGRGPTAAAATTTTGGGSSSTGSNKGTSGKTEPVYAGGIFSRLEAQFRAEQAARALALQGTQTRCVHNILLLSFKLYGRSSILLRRFLCVYILLDRCIHTVYNCGENLFLHNLL